MVLIVDFLNLTNGIERLNYDFEGSPHFVRIQSTALEQKRFGQVIADLDYDFLLHLAAGNLCRVHDYSAKKVKTRALYQGLSWIEFYLTRYWKGYYLKECYVKKCNVANYFTEICESLGRVPDNVVYGGRFFGGQIRLVAAESKKTEHDGDYAFYKDILTEGSWKY